ncbi:MAG: aspartate carbamoyltransferase catalytic subunit [Thermacetogeniaceae bacterium]|jgi:aspartate carbamoyltransferase catalytic subunit|nr:aspartate carbamoyltransferase catalytic subunit [Thermoanaerobacterales bacterium]NLN21912.1 aspartate carbamoyltransferase catalytic subunit [Syntrophomonadaceae bacterium]
MKFKRKDVLGLEDLTAEEINLILDTAEPMKEIMTRDIKKVPTLRGRSVITLFYEPSTRTRSSFELAAKYLGADTSSIAIANSSVQKGESLRDTAKTLEAMAADVIIIRHNAAGAPHLLARWVSARVINAGDGAHEHPTQALLDMFTIREKKGGFQGLKVAILGDITHSRVARSNIWGLTKMGAEVRVVGPATLIPPEIERLGVKAYHDWEEGLKDVDVINVLRIQLERQKKGLFPSIREYTRLYGLDQRKLQVAKPDVLVLHPGPVNRGIEISPDVQDGPHAAINEQVTNGVAVRMALLYLLMSGGEKDEISA